MTELAPRHQQGASLCSDERDFSQGGPSGFLNSTKVQTWKMQAIADPDAVGSPAESNSITVTLVRGLAHEPDRRPQAPMGPEGPAQLHLSYFGPCPISRRLRLRRDPPNCCHPSKISDDSLFTRHARTLHGQRVFSPSGVSRELSRHGHGLSLTCGGGQIPRWRCCETWRVCRGKTCCTRQMVHVPVRMYRSTAVNVRVVAKRSRWCCFFGQRLD